MAAGEPQPPGIASCLGFRLPNSFPFVSTKRKKKKEKRKKERKKWLYPITKPSYSQDQGKRGKPAQDK